MNFMYVRSDKFPYRATTQLAPASLLSPEGTFEPNLYKLPDHVSDCN